MKAIAVLLLFIGMFLVIQGYYKIEKKCADPQIKIQYIPMSLYEEQLSNDPKLSISNQFKGMFQDINPWPKTTG